MSGLAADRMVGILRAGWSATADDYAIAGDWASNGSVLVVIDAAGSVFGFEGTSGAIRWAHRGAHEGGALCLAVHPGGGEVATAGQDGRIVIWKSADGSVSRVVDLGGGWIENLSWSSDGRLLAASNSRRVYVCDGDGQEIWRSENHPSTVSALSWSQSKELAVACYGRVTFYGADSGKAGQQLEWKGSLVSMVLSPDGDIVACGSQDNSVHFWRRSTGQDSMMSGYPGKPAALAFDASGSFLATSGGEAVTIWNFTGEGPEGTRPGSLQLHSEFVTSLTFARTKRRLASGARDGSVVVWAVQEDGTGNPEGAAQLAHSIAGLAWRPDGRGLAALDAQGGVTAWRLGK